MLFNNVVDRLGINIRVSSLVKDNEPLGCFYILIVKGFEDGHWGLLLYNDLWKVWI